MSRGCAERSTCARRCDVPLTSAERAVLDKIDEDHLVELARSLLRAKGQNPPGEEAAMVALLAGAAAELGLDVCEVPVQPGRNNMRATLAGGAGPGLLMLGHTDVVPVGEGWTKDPFGGVIENGRIYGRGASDMKGGLAASLSAMAALRGTELTGPVELAALVDEEETGIGIRAYVLGACAIIPGLRHRGAHRPADHHRRARRLLPTGRCPRNRRSRRQSRRRRERDIRCGRGRGRD